MTVYIIPATTVILSFLALLSTARLLFSRQGLYWIFPVLMSGLFMYNNLQELINLAELAPESFEYNFNNFYPFTMAVLWNLMVTVFQFVLRKHVEDNRFENDSRKNRREAEYLEKHERRKTGRLRKKSGKSSPIDALQVPDIPEYRVPEDID